MVLNRAIATQIKEILEQNPQGLSITEIVKKSGINRNTVGRYLENMLVSGHVEMHHLGMAKIYSPAHRVPVSAVLSISSELIIQLDSRARIVFANDAFCRFIGTTAQELLGKNIQYTLVVPVFEDRFEDFFGYIQDGLSGKDWKGQIDLPRRGVIFSCTIAPTVLEEGLKGVSVILEDVTVQRQAEERLKESEERYRLLSEASRDIIYVVSHDDTIEYVNSFAARSLGKMPKEIIGRPRSSFFPPGLSQVQKKNLDHVFATGIPSRSEGELRVNGGEMRWFDHFLMPVMSADGKVSSVFGVSRDITARKRAEVSLKESEERYRLLLQRSFDAVIIHHNGFVTLANDAAAKLFGAPSPNAMLGADIMDHIHPDSKEIIQRRLVDLREGSGNAVEIREEKFTRPDGTIFYVEVAAVGFVDKGVPAVQVLFRDITRRKELVEALRLSEEKYRTLVEHSQTGVFIIQGSMIQYANAALARMLGTIPEALLLRDVREFLAPEDKDWVSERVLLRQQGSPAPHAYEISLLKHDGRSRVAVSLDAGLIQYQNKPACMGTIRDISSQKAAENSLRINEERLARIFESSPFGIATLDSECRILLVNNRFTAMLGLKRTDLESRYLGELIHNDDWKKIQSILENVADDDSLVPVNGIRIRDGTGVYQVFAAVVYGSRNEAGTVSEYYLRFSPGPRLPAP
jgi:PAS domain S-box-containing protein